MATRDPDTISDIITSFAESSLGRTITYDVVTMTGTTDTFAESTHVRIRPAAGDLVSLGSSGSTTVTYFKMRGMDKNTNGLYDTWRVTSSPDFTGSSYAGALATPLRDIVLVATWTV